MGLVFCSMWAYYTYFRGSVKDTDARAAFKSLLMKALLVIMLLAVFLPSSPSGGKILNIGENPFYFNRIDIYKAALKMGRDRLITGWGIGSFGKVFPAYNFPVNAIARYQMETPFAHNEFLQVFAVLGIPGLAFFLFLIFNIFKNPF